MSVFSGTMGDCCCEEEVVKAEAKAARRVDDLKRREAAWREEDNVDNVKGWLI